MNDEAIKILFKLYYIYIEDFNKTIKRSEEDLCVLLLGDL